MHQPHMYAQGCRNNQPFLICKETGEAYRGTPKLSQSYTLQCTESLQLGDPKIFSNWSLCKEMATLNKGTGTIDVL